VSPRVRFEPLGEDIDCARDETVLDAAFRHGYNLVYGCREGQCSACKCFLAEGDASLKRYSSFALSDSERANGYSLMCRAMPESDLVVELLHYDPDGYRLEFPIREGTATVELVAALTHDISRLVLRVDEPSDFSFVPGQYVDLHVPGADGARRSFSLANVPGDGRLELVVKRYPGGRFSGLLGSSVRPGTQLRFTGPYGALRVRSSERPILIVAAGTGMAPMLSLLRQLASESCRRPVRFFYGARTEADLFLVDEIEALGSGLPDFRFVTVLSARDGRHVQDAVDACLGAAEIAGPDAYLCGAPAMVQAVEEMLVARHKVDEQRIFADRFTASADAAPAADLAARPDDAGREFEWFQPRKRRATLD
jgi:propane monooxygenase reductase component